MAADLGRPGAEPPRAMASAAEVAAVAPGPDPALPAALRAVQHAIGRIEESVAILLVVAMAVVVNLQIAARYLFDAPLVWPEEVSRMILVWLTFVAAAALARRGGEIAVDLFVARLRPAARRTAETARDLLLLALFAVVCRLAIGFADAVSGMPLVATEWSTAWLAWPVAIGAGLIALHVALRLVAAVSRRGVENRA